MVCLKGQQFIPQIILNEKFTKQEDYDTLWKTNWKLSFKRTFKKFANECQQIGD